MEKISAKAEDRGMKKANKDALLSPEMRPDRVGMRMRAMREALKLKSSEFADAVGIDRSAYSRIERGDEGLSIKNAVIMSDLFGFGLDYIYKGVTDDIPLKYRRDTLLALYKIQQADGGSKVFSNDLSGFDLEPHQLLQPVGLGSTDLALTVFDSRSATASVESDDEERVPAGR